MEVNNIPTLEEVKKHFCKAKSIKCLIKNITVDVTGISNFEYNENDKKWTSVGGKLVLWEKGNYADIVSETKECNCK